MNTSIKLAADPYAGVRAAFLSLYPSKTDEDWEHWIERHRGVNADFDNFSVMAELCHAAVQNCLSLDALNLKLISYAAGHFDAMHRTVMAIVDIQHTSAVMPNHFERYRENLRKFPERYVD